MAPPFPPPSLAWMAYTWCWRNKRYGLNPFCEPVSFFSPLFQSLDWSPSPAVSYLIFLITQDPVKKQLNSSPVKVSYLLTEYGTHFHPSMDGTRAFFSGDTVCFIPYSSTSVSVPFKFDAQVFVGGAVPYLGSALTLWRILSFRPVFYLIFTTDTPNRYRDFYFVR